MNPTRAWFLKPLRRLLSESVSVHPLLVGLAIASIGALFTADWMLLRYTNRLESALQERAASLAPTKGVQVPPMQGWTTAGEVVTVDYSTDPRKTLLLVFSTDCALADANWDYWEAMATQIDTSRFRLVYANIATSFPEHYIRTHHFHPDALVLTRVDPQSAVDYSLSLSPMVLLLGADATIEAVWLGVMKEASRRAIESALSITLAQPGA